MMVDCQKKGYIEDLAFLNKFDFLISQSVGNVTDTKCMKLCNDCSNKIS